MMHFNDSNNYTVSVNVDTQVMKGSMNAIAADIVAMVGCMWVDNSHVKVTINDSTVDINSIMGDTVTDGYGTYNFHERYNDTVVKVLSKGLFEAAMMNSKLFNSNGTFNAWAVTLNEVTDTINVSVALGSTPGVHVSFKASLVWRINAICHTEICAYARLVTR